MIGINVANEYLTITSIVVTVISIVMTVVSIWQACRAYRYAKQAKKYKDEAFFLVDVLKLDDLCSRFRVESRMFQEKTRLKQWYKGVDINTIISPYASVISDLGEIYHLINKDLHFEEKVNSLNHTIQRIGVGRFEEVSGAHTLILEITNILQQEIVRNKQKVNT